MARSPAIWACLALAVPACGDNEVPQGAIRSGSRLRAMYFADPQGDRLFRGWFDRELGVECAWTGGDAPRCLPARLDTSVFADAACTEPLVEMPPPADPPDPCAVPAPSYVGVRRDACAWDAVDEVWAFSAATATVTTVYQYTAETGACVERPADPAYAYRRVEPVPADRFVGGERVDDVGRGRVRTRTIVADDGALAPLGAYDHELAAGCSPDQERGCLPDASFAGTAEDSGCDHPIVGEPTACEPPPYIAMYQTEPTSYFARGEVLTSDPAQVLDLYNMSVVITDTGWSCSPFQATVTPGYTLYRAGAAIADAGFAPVVEERGAGARIQPAYLRAGNHRAITGYHDTQLELPCAPTEVAPGAWRCLPALHGIWTRFFFADPACTEPLEVLFHYGDEPSLPGVRYEQEGACAYRQRLHAPGALLPLGTYFASFDGVACEAYDPGDPGITAYTVGAEVPFDPYAALELVTE
jgi:hypothetical protein